MRVRSAIACVSVALFGVVTAQDTGSTQLPAQVAQAPLLSPETAEKHEYQVSTALECYMIGSLASGS